MEGIEGKSFSILDPKGINTVIYRVNKTSEEYLNQYPKYTIERLISANELTGDMSRKTFFIDEPESHEDLVILSFAKERVVVNMGILQKDEIKISKKPIPIKFDTLYTEQEVEYKEFKYTPNLKRQISIIDPETTEEIKPTLYFDPKAKEVKAKCKLQPYKSYFAFEISD